MIIGYKISISHYPSPVLLPHNLEANWEGLIHFIAKQS